MADTKGSDLTVATEVLDTDGVVIVKDPSGTPETQLAPASLVRFVPTPVGQADGRMLAVASDALVYVDAPSGGGGGTELGWLVAPSSPDSMDDEFAGSSLDGKWTLVNESTTSFVVDQSVLSINPPASSSWNVRTIEQTIPNPTGEWEYRARMWHLVNNGVAQAYGLAARETATQKSVVCGPVNITAGAGLWGGAYTNNTTFNATIGTQRIIENYSAILVPVEIKLARVGTDIVGQFRYGGGGAWIPIFTVAEATYFTTRADRIGISIGQTVNNAGQFGYCDYFRRIA